MREHSSSPRAWWSVPLSLWGVGGVTALLLSAIWRLTPLAVEPIHAGSLQVWHWAVMAVWIAFMAWAEGYRGFQTKFSPRTAARALHLGRHPTPLRAVLAPLFCMGFFGATRKVRITAWSVTIMVICLVLLVGALEQPWRGIIDAGVVIGLLWGVLSLLAFFVRGLVTGELPVDPQLPR